MLKLSTVQPPRHKEVEDVQCDSFLRVAGKSESLLPSLVTDSCFMILFFISDNYVCIGGDLNLIKRFKLVLIVF